MNWKEIKEKCPKSFDLWDDYSWWFQYWDDKAHHIEGICVQHNDNRCLYDFFDVNEIFASIELTISETGIANEAIYTPYVNSELISGDFETRKEAEIIAFTHAFETLENRL